jgi:hypothetical protein
MTFLAALRVAGTFLVRSPHWWAADHIAAVTDECERLARSDFLHARDEKPRMQLGQ